MKKKYGAVVLFTAGLAILAAGLVLLLTLDDPQGPLQALPYVLIGLGCGAFGYGAGELLSRAAIKKHPELQKQIEIEKNDERNVAIGYRAKAKAYDIMVFVFGALLLAFALMGTETAAVLLLVFAYLFVVGCGVYYRVKYDREM